MTIRSLLVLTVAVLFAAPAYGQAAGTRHVVLVGGRGGDPAYTDRFAGYLAETRSLFTGRLGVPEDQVHVLAEEALAGRPFVDAVSTAENIRAHFDRLAGRVTADDHLYVVLFGHGSFDGTNARLNIPRRDLDDDEYAAMVDRVGAGRVVFVNTASASGPFAAALAGPDRVVITATATGTERDETVFPRFFVEALRSPEADLDRNGGLSVREAFVFAAGQAARSFEETGHLATEHAQIEDDGDGEPTRLEVLEAGTDGHLASVTYLSVPAAVAAAGDAALPLLREKAEIERAVAEVKSRKASMSEDAYYDELETLFVRLARLNARIEGGEQTR